MSFSPNHLGNWRADRNDRVRIRPQHGTKPVRWATAGTGNTAGSSPGAIGSSARGQAGLVGGSRFHLLQATNGGVANTLRRWIADRLTVADPTLTGNLTFGTNTVTRVSGSFLADGWQVEDTLLFDGNDWKGPDNAFSCAVGVISAISADGKTLTLPANTFATGGTPGVGTSIWRGIQQPLAPLNANAGNAADAPAMNLLTLNNPGVATSADTANFVLGAGQALFAAVGTTLATGVFVDLTAIGGDY